jgi:hypothetical protein
VITAKIFEEYENEATSGEAVDSQVNEEVFISGKSDRAFGSSVVVEMG